MANKYVLDSSVILAFVRGEAGSHNAEAMLDEAVISSVNFSEVLSVCHRDNISTDDINEIEKLMGTVIDFDSTLAREAAKMITQTKAYGLSLGDRACLATAQKLGAIAVTADKAWLKLKLPVKIKLIR